MKQLAFLLSLCVLVLLSGCQPTSTTSARGMAKPAFPVPLPATFTGELSTRECSRFDITLNLRRAGVYQLRAICTEGGNTRTSLIGYWKYDAEQNLLVFGQNRQSLKTMTFIDDHTLRLVDAADLELDIHKNYDLHLSDTLDPFEDVVDMRGMFLPEGKGGRMTECRSGVTLPVAPEKDISRLKEQYNSTPHGQKEPMLVEIRGSLRLRPDPKAKDLVETIVVERFVQIFPGQNCRGKIQCANLFNTTWKLIELDGKPIRLDEGRREPYIVLETEGNRMHGFAGCNRFFGTYLVKGEIFVFNKMASTRMACLKGLDLEDNFLEAMRKTEAYRIDNHILELRDGEEEVLARLEEVK